MKHRGTQDALCPYCGAIFRTRTHSTECHEQELPLDPKLLEVIKRISESYVKETINNRMARLEEQK